MTSDWTVSEWADHAGVNWHGLFGRDKTTPTAIYANQSDAERMRDLLVKKQAVRVLNGAA